MQIVRLSQDIDREAWLEERRGLATGSKAKSLKPLSRGEDRTPAGFWDLAAERISVAQDGEPPRDRGKRLEREAAAMTVTKLKLKNPSGDPGLWVSDFSKFIGVSPDDYEDTDKPTWAIESKSVGNGKHLKYVWKDIKVKELPDYRAFNSIPNETGCFFREQLIQYFLVNEDLKVLYFTLYNDLFIYDWLVHHVITIKREDVLEQIEQQKNQQLETIKQVNSILKEIKIYGE